MKQWENSFLIKIDPVENDYRIILREKNSSRLRDYPRRIELLISSKSRSYSITFYEIQKNELNKECYKEKYNITVNGDNNIEAIKKNMEELIQGKDDTYFRLIYPF